MEYITIHQWLPLKKETRETLAKIFFVRSTGMVEVVTDEFGKSHVVKDGYTNVDLQVITAEKLVDYLGTAAVNETVHDLWKRVVEKVENVGTLTEEMLKSNMEAVVKAEKEIIVFSKPQNTADNQLICEKCPFKTGNKRALTAHKTFKHNRVKVA